MTIRGKSMVTINALIVDESVGAAYLCVGSGNVATTLEATVMADFDSNGKLIGVEFMSWPVEERVKCKSCQLPWCGCLEIDIAKEAGFEKGWRAAMEYARKHVMGALENE